MSEPIVVFARSLVTAGQEQAMESAPFKAIEPTRAEPENIPYDLQAPVQPAVFYFHEQWRDEAAVQWPMDTAH